MAHFVRPVLNRAQRWPNVFGRQTSNRWQTKSFASLEHENLVGASTFPVPLVERDGESIATVSELLEWRKWARAYAERACLESNIKSDLPCIESLLTEVDWLVEDVIAGARLRRERADGNWQDVGRLAHGNRLPTAGEVLLRETLEGLKRMWMQRILERVPLQYLTASCHWRDLFLVVTPDVLIPRPETEKMVDLVADALRRSPTLADTPWVDLGTGSGAIAIGIANELSTMRSQTMKELDIGQDNIVVHAVDVSPAAAAVARHNVERNSAIFGKRKVAVKVHEGSWYEPLNVLEGGSQPREESSRARFGGIVSNPPYIPSLDMSELQPEVRLHEPWLALEGGSDMALDSLLPICLGAAAHLVPGGFLLLETNGGNQARAVVEFLLAFRGKEYQNSRDSKNGYVFDEVQLHSDFCQVERFVSARKRV